MKKSIDKSKQKRILRKQKNKKQKQKQTETYRSFLSLAILPYYNRTVISLFFSFTIQINLSEQLILLNMLASKKLVYINNMENQVINSKVL